MVVLSQRESASAINLEQTAKTKMELHKKQNLTLHKKPIKKHYP